MSSTTPGSLIDENFADENVSADKAANECEVISPPRSILKDSNVCNIFHSSPQSLDTVKVVHCFLCTSIIH